MNPNERQKIIEEVTREVLKTLGNYSTIPFDVEKAMARRLNLNIVPTITEGSKLANSENQLVTEAGAGTYNVLKTPDSFKLLSDANGNPIGYTAIWTS